MAVRRYGDRWWKIRNPNYSQYEGRHGAVREACCFDVTTELIPLSQRRNALVPRKAITVARNSWLNRMGVHDPLLRRYD